MHATSFALFNLVVVVLGAPGSPSRRSASSIESDISTISSELTTLDSQIDSFDGGLLSALSLLVTFNDLQSDITTATSDVESTGALSDSDSATIYSNAEALTTQITSVLSDVEAKVSTVASSGYTSYVLEALSELKTDAANFFSALEAEVGSSYLAPIETLASTVDSAFTTAIGDY
ncbi:hydrophobic surface binding protein A-domain-containing protein [Xylariales sp. PMI_506]|nr:hydrophobic surface binding protein A-domain-containing protein [Xylariales sp. PMI_506]